MSSSMYSISSSPPHVSQCCNHLKPARVFSKHWPSLERRIFQTQQILPGKDAYCLGWLRGRASGNEWRLGATRHLFVSRLRSSSSLSSHYHHHPWNCHLRHLCHHHHREWMAKVRDTRHLFVPCLPSNPLEGPSLFNRKTGKRKGPDTYYKLKESARELSQFDIFTRHWKKKQTVSSGSNVSSVSSVLK